MNKTLVICYQSLSVKINWTAAQELGKPFKEWLLDHKLFLILPLFYETQTSQGYGYIEEVPTYYGMSSSAHNLLINAHVLCCHDML